jgi:hypothetical protein
MLRARYVRDGSPDLVFHDASAGVCGVGLTRNQDHSFTFDMTNAVDMLPPALSPSMPPVDSIQFQRVNGGLVYLLPIRHDIRKVVVHLCSKNKCPTEIDRAAQTHLLRYLKGCPSLGPTIGSTNNISLPGIHIVGASDAAHAVHTDGSSQSSLCVSIGAD